MPYGSVRDERRGNLVQSPKATGALLVLLSSGSVSVMVRQMVAQKKTGHLSNRTEDSFVFACIYFKHLNDYLLSGIME